MKPIARALLLVPLSLLLAAAPARAELCRDWSTQDTWLQSIGAALIVVDWYQTRDLAAHQVETKTECNPLCKTTTIERAETNPFLGRHPTPAEINLKIGTGLILFMAASCALPPAWRTFVQGTVIGFESYAIFVNAQRQF